jgi:hypothetical protein
MALSDPETRRELRVMHLAAWINVGAGVLIAAAGLGLDIALSAPVLRVPEILGLIALYIPLFAGTAAMAFGLARLGRLERLRDAGRKAAGPRTRRLDGRKARVLLDTSITPGD